MFSVVGFTASITCFVHWGTALNALLGRDVDLDLTDSKNNRLGFQINNATVRINSSLHSTGLASTDDSTVLHGKGFITSTSTALAEKMLGVTDALVEKEYFLVVPHGLLAREGWLGLGCLLLVLWEDEQ